MLLVILLGQSFQTSIATLFIISAHTIHNPLVLLEYHSNSKDYGDQRVKSNYLRDVKVNLGLV